MFFDTGEDLCKYVAGRTGGETILGFSTGKDSIAAWLALRPFFKRIVPVYMYPIPGLKFIEESLAYYEDWFKTKIVRLPNPNLYRMLKNLVLQAPENCRIIEEFDVPQFTRRQLDEIVRQDWKMNRNAYCATGVRARDSLNRWASIKKYGPVNDANRTFYPVFDWDKSRLMTTIRESGIRLPVDYQLFGRTLDGIDYRFMKPLKERFPDDYARVLEFFPMAELELKRIEYREAYYSGKKQTETAAQPGPDFDITLDADTEEVLL